VQPNELANTHFSDVVDGARTRHLMCRDGSVLRKRITVTMCSIIASVDVPLRVKLGCLPVTTLCLLFGQERTYCENSQSGTSGQERKNHPKTNLDSSSKGLPLSCVLSEKNLVLPIERYCATLFIGLQVNRPIPAKQKSWEEEMSKEVHWLLELKVNSDKLSDFRKVMAEMIEATRIEDGTIAYEWCFNDVESICNIYERYADSDAAMIHLQGFAKFADRFLAAVTPTKFTVLGHPNAVAQSALAAFSPVFLTTKAGFAKFG
jgi:quinol monooxygenase YgiN